MKTRDLKVRLLDLYFKLCPSITLVKAIEWNAKNTF